MVYELSRIAVDGALLCCCLVFGRGCDCAWLKASILVANVDLQMTQVNLGKCCASALSTNASMSVKTSVGSS